MENHDIEASGNSSDGQHSVTHRSVFCRATYLHFCFWQHGTKVNCEQHADVRELLVTANTGSGVKYRKAP